jgi:hypothetical protein
VGIVTSNKLPHIQGDLVGVITVWEKAACIITKVERALEVISCIDILIKRLRAAANPET